MSRCFPFPPPGYESKTKANDLDLLLKKEKHKEKKHKKEKRDKEKKEGKEKREKDRNDEKHREKKDKKEKSRDKKKDKEKDGNKDKHKSDGSCPDEKKVMGPSGGLLAMPSEKSKDREKDRNAMLAEKKVAGVSTFRNGEQVSKSNFRASSEIKSNPLALETKSTRLGPELAQRSYDGERRPINQLPDKIVGTEGKKADEVARVVGKSAGLVVDGKERSKDKAALDGRVDVRGVVGESRSSGNALVPNSVGLVQIRVAGAARPMEKKAGQRAEGKEKLREKEGDDRKGDKWKDREKPIHRDKDREKEKKKEEKVKVTSEQKHIDQSRIKDSSDNHTLTLSVKDGIKKEFSSAPNAGVQKIPKESHQVVAPNNLGKRKDIGLNGIDDEHSTGPHKLARTTASPHPLTENGRSLEPCQNSAALAPGTQRPPMNIKVERTFAPDDTQRPPTNIKVDGKERKINGIISQPVTQQPSQTSIKAEQKLVAPSKPPHPDIKYLSQVLSVPKVDDWSDFDDQDWLFNSSSSQTRTLEAESSGIDKPQQQVWAKALWLEPVDVYALPYVIPH